MLNITNVPVPSKTDLQDIVDEMLTYNSHDDCIKKHVAGIAGILDDTPLMYRNYGNWWWSVKDVLARNGEVFGDDMENITLNRFRYDDDLYTLAAAWAYSQVIIEKGYIYQSVHTLDAIDEDNEVSPLEYSIEDTDMEAMAL